MVWRSLFVLLFVAVLIAPVQGWGGAERQQEPLTIRTSSGAHDFRVELATPSDQQATGLMYRRKMAADAGMLFVYPSDAPVSMWMKNTFIPLDMFFIGSDGRITHIAERTVPQSTELIGSNGPVRAVLELNGGTASRLGIRPGDRVIHRIFR